MDGKDRVFSGEIKMKKPNNDYDPDCLLCPFNHAEARADQGQEQLLNCLNAILRVRHLRSGVQKRELTSVLETLLK